MAKLLSFDSFSTAKSLSDSLATAKTPALKKKPSSISSSVVQQKLFDLQRKANSSPSSEQRQNLLSWLRSQSLHNQHFLFHFTDPFWASILTQMYIHKYNNGNFLFALIGKNSRKMNSLEFKSIFSVKKVGQATSLKEDCLEKALRFADNEEYCDSLALSLEFLRNFDEVLEVFEEVSAGECFKVPCRLVQDGGKRVSAEYPEWFNPFEAHSLAAWACFLLEKQIWTHFLTQTANSSTKDIQAPTDSIAALVEVYTSIRHSDKLSQFINKEFFEDKFSELYNKLKNFHNFPIFVGPPSSDIYKAKDSEHNFQCTKSIASIFNHLAKPEEDFVEYLFFSPINRTGSILDLLLRTLCMKIKELYHFFLAESLISLEKPSKAQKSFEKTVKTKGPQKPYKEKHYQEACKQVCQSLTSKLFKTLYSNILETHPKVSEVPIVDDSNFQVVQKKTRRPPQPQTVQHLTEVQRSKPRFKLSKKKPKVKKSLYLWERNQASHQYKATNESDFPPLSPAVPKETNDTLHQEILKYGDSTARKVQNKFQFVCMMLHKIEIVIAEQLGGCIRLYGSYATGLAIESSDIDLGIMGVDLHNRHLLYEACETLNTSLRLLPFVISFTPILTAKVPIIKLQVDLQPFSGVPSPLLVDISFVETYECAHQGFQAISFTKNLLVLFPSIRYLTMVLKNFLYSINLNSSYYGNL